METDWICRLKQDDETALCEIIGQYTGYVYTILRNFSHGTLPPEDLEELAADVFLRLWNSRDRLRDDSDLAPYLAAIARNGVKNCFRRLGKQPPVRQSYEDLTLSDSRDLCGDAEMVEMIACLFGDPILFLWRKDLCAGKRISHDRCRGTAKTAPQQRKTPKADDRKGF